MKARIIAPFSVSAVAFILSWFAIQYGGYGWLAFFGAGVVLAGAGILFAADERR